jgi:hypothetical protein
LFQDYPFPEHGNDNHFFFEDAQAPMESILTDEQMEELTDLLFPPNLVSNAEPEQQSPSALPHTAASVDSIWRALESNSSTNEPSIDSTTGFGLGDSVSLKFPVIDAVQTQPQGLPMIEELVSPGAAALRESDGSAKKPRHGSCFVDVTLIS